METPTEPFYIRQADPKDETAVAENFYRMWEDYNLNELLREDWLESTHYFIAQAKADLSFAAFVAEIDRQIVGSAACQRFSGLYPDIFERNKRSYGYIWGVYVAPQHRGKGIGKAPTKVADDHLRSVGCTYALLHALPMGKPVYTSLGFVESNEMKLDFTQ